MKLKPCPDSPNCVSSQSKDQAHYVEPISYSGSSSDAMKRIKELILALPRTRLVDENGSRLHFEFETRFFKFIDDVDIVSSETDKVMHIRSASRTGHWDLGVNRRRVEFLRKKFQAL